VKIPDPAELNPIEIAVRAAEFVRVRSARDDEAVAPVVLRDEYVDRAIDSANHTIDDLRRARDRR
jgi:hypothetical protein